MNLEKMQELVVNSLEDMKAQEISVLDVRERSTMTDLMIIATGNSTRHVKSIAGNLIKDIKAVNMLPIGSEGEDNGEWVLVDLNEIIVHVMQRDVRDFYNLEKIWVDDESQDQAVT